MAGLFVSNASERFSLGHFSFLRFVYDKIEVDAKGRRPSFIENLSAREETEEIFLVHPEPLGLTDIKLSLAIK